MTAPTRLLCLVLLAASCLGQAFGKVVVLGADRNLIPALNDSTVTEIVLTADYDLDPEQLRQLEDAPLYLTRNITVSGPAGGPAPVLDLHFAHAVLQLCGACVFTLANLAVANERRGTGPTYDVFVGDAFGETGSVVRAVNVTRVRLACTPAPDSAEIIQHTQRSTLLPGSQKQQAFTFVDATFKGARYPQSLRNVDVTRDVLPLYEEGRGRSGSYAIADINTTRICKHTVEHSCLQHKGPDACVNHKIDELLGDMPLATAAPEGRGRAGGLPHAALAAAVAVPLAAAGILLLVGLVLWQHRRQRVQAEVAKAADEERGGDGGARRAYSRHSQERTSNSSSRPEQDSFPADRKPRQPLGEGPGWSLTNSLTSPCIAAGSNTRVEFGDCIGCGSFGRVFRAHWASMDVAVKVIEHSSDTSEAVQQEAALMLSLNHHNIIKAFHCVTFSSSTPAVTITRALQGSGSNSGSLPSTATPGSLSACNQQQQLPREGCPAAVEARQVVAPASAGPVSPVSGMGQCAADWGSSPGCTDGFMGTSDSIQSGVDEGPAHCETWLIQEYADVGTLQAVSSKWPPAAQGGEAELYRLMLLRDAAAGLCELHRSGIVHGDLNARNVLVSSSAMSRCGLVGKLADLGLSRVIHRNKTHRTTNSCGTMSCMPPELLANGRMSPAGDIYALAIMMWEMASGCQAFRKLQYGAFFATIVLRDQRPPLLPGLAPDYQTLMQHCWATNPADRPTSPQVLTCLDWMISQRLRTLAGDDTDEAGEPPALLLKPPPPRLQMPQQPQPGSPSSCMPVSASAAGTSCSASSSSSSAGDDDGGACSYQASTASPLPAATAEHDDVAGSHQAVDCPTDLKPPAATGSNGDTAEWSASCEFRV